MNINAAAPRTQVHDFFNVSAEKVMRPALSEKAVGFPGSTGDISDCRGRLPYFPSPDRFWLPAFPEQQPVNPLHQVIQQLVSVLERLIPGLVNLIGLQPPPPSVTPPATPPTPPGNTAPGGASTTPGNPGTTPEAPGGAPAPSKPPHCGTRPRPRLDRYDGMKASSARHLAKDHGLQVRVIREGQRIPADFRDNRVTLVVDRNNRVLDARYC